MVKFFILKAENLLLTSLYFILYFAGGQTAHVSVALLELAN